MNRSALYRLATLLLAVSIYLPALAQDVTDIPGYPRNVQGYDPREVAALPGYCKYTQLFRDHVPGGNDPIQIAHWYQVMGHSFHAMHHYCWGLMKTNRALLLARTKQLRTYYLRSSIQEYDYVIAATPEDFFMLPEIYAKRGENLLRLHEVGEGLASLQHSIQLKADYWPPYAALSDYFSSVGQDKRAIEWLRKGLETSPGAKPLQERLSALSTKPSKRSVDGNQAANEP